MREVRLEQLFEAISKETGYQFKYNVDDLDDVTKRFTAQGTVNVSELLDKILKNTPLSYKIEGNVILSPLAKVIGLPFVVR